MNSATIRPLRVLLPWAMTACWVVAGPPLAGAAQASPAATLTSAALALTVLAIAFAIRQRKPQLLAVAPARRRIHTLGWAAP